jgi:hypothetical protein
MTKVELRFRLSRPADQTLLERMAAAHGMYGIHRVKLADGAPGELVVEFDASRLSPEDVASILLRAGIPAGPYN